jgi:uncharacterized protein YjdB
MKKVLRTVLIAAAMAAAMALAGCAKITGVTLGEDVALNVGETATLSPTYTTEKAASEKDIAAAAAQLKPTWASSDDTIATVDSAGIVTAVAPGAAEITLAAGEYTDTVTITVEQPVESILVQDMTISTAVPGIQPQYAFLPHDATEQPTVTLSSSDSDVLVVNGKAIVPVTAGTATLTITAESGVKGSCTVTVRQAPAEITLKDISVAAGKTAKLTLTTAPVKCEVGNTWTYTVANTRVATVDNDGVVTGVAEGSTTLTAQNELGQAVSCTITVSKTAAKATAKTSGTTSAAAATTSGAGTTTSPATQPAPDPAPAPDPTPEQVIHDSPGVQLDPNAGNDAGDLT